MNSRVVRHLFAFALFASGIVACLQQPGSGADGGVGDGGATALADGGAAGPQAQGIDCITEPSTGVQICTGISTCPKVLVDHDVYPNCGFRIRGTVLDLECACSGSICPIGAPSTCDQAAAILANQNETLVCQQLNEGRCVAGNPAPANSGPASTCDKTCAAECAGDPNCVRICGC